MGIKYPPETSLQHKKKMISAFRIKDGRQRYKLTFSCYHAKGRRNKKRLGKRTLSAFLFEYLKSNCLYSVQTLTRIVLTIRGLFYMYTFLRIQYSCLILVIELTSTKEGCPTITTSCGGQIIRHHTIVSLLIVTSYQKIKK